MPWCSSTRHKKSKKIKAIRKIRAIKLQGLMTQETGGLLLEAKKCFSEQNYEGAVEKYSKALEIM